MGIHGAGMTAGDLEARLGFGGVEINQDGPITDEEADLIAKKIAAKLPERIYAYSRGSAALNKAFLDDDMPASVPPVTYIAPAALRSRWGTPPIPKLPAGSITIVGDSDRNIPVKQACKIASAAGTDLYIYPDKHHTSILYTGGSTQGATKLDPGKCLADKEMPDWGDETVEKDSPKLQTQKARVRDLTGEALVRAYIFETIR
jgi:hypothetical protein|tara:strand:+ start:111 stop:719 length:609 start_codon:yes stop_codon:yes gene_type:complete